MTYTVKSKRFSVSKTWSKSGPGHLCGICNNQKWYTYKKKSIVEESEQRLFIKLEYFKLLLLLLKFSEVHRVSQIWWSIKRAWVDLKVQDITNQVRKHTPSESIIRSRAKYSTKNWVLCFIACPYSVCSNAWPVRSAAHAHRYACPPVPINYNWKWGSS